MFDKELEELENKIKQFPHFYIYGAGVVAYGAYCAIKELFGIVPEAFVVTEQNENQHEIHEIKIIPLVQINKEFHQTIFLIATPEEYHKNIKEGLSQKNYKNILLLDSKLEYFLMSDYLKKTREISTIEDFVSEQHCLKKMPVEKDVCIYMAVSDKDKKLKEIYHEPDWVKKIQVGSNLAPIYFEEMRDNIGENISDKNPTYGELTATYWAWKNDIHKVVGVFHYRRVLDISIEELQLLDEGKVDVILPLPFVCNPDASGQYGRYLSREDIEIMKAVLVEKHTLQKDEIEQILKKDLIYNYNILIARKEVFEEYCNWLFPLLFEIEATCENFERERLTRYLGRVGEVLTSIYFFMNRHRWNISHAKKIWRT